MHASSIFFSGFTKPLRQNPYLKVFPMVLSLLIISVQGFFWQTLIQENKRGGFLSRSKHSSQPLSTAFRYLDCCSFSPVLLMVLICLHQIFLEGKPSISLKPWSQEENFRLFWYLLSCLLRIQRTMHWIIPSGLPKTYFFSYQLLFFSSSFKNFLKKFYHPDTYTMKGENKLQSIFFFWMTSQMLQFSDEEILFDKMNME